MVASSRTCGWARALVSVWIWSAVLLRAPSIMLAMSGIWLMGCQFTRSGEVLVVHRMAGGAELPGDAAHVHGVPDQHGIGEQAEAAGLVHDLLVVAGAEVALVGEKDPSGEDVAELAAVELQLYGLAQRLLVDVAQDMDGLDQAPELGQCIGQTVGGGRVGEALHDDMGRRHPGFQRRDQTHQLIPLLNDDADVDGAAEQWLEWAVVGGAIDAAEHLVWQVLQPRHEGDAEQGAQAEQVLGEPMGIGGVFADDEGGVVVENAAEHVAGFARRAGDCLRRVNAVQVGGVGIEGERAIVVAEVAGIEAAQQAVALHREALPVGGGAAAVTPDAAERQAEMVIDQPPSVSPRAGTTGWCPAAPRR